MTGVIADGQDDDTSSRGAGEGSDSEVDQKPKISTPRQKAAAAKQVKKEVKEEVETPVKKVRPSG